MDGNGRWAQQRNQQRADGHRKGLEAARRLVKFVADNGVASHLTLFAFSDENWQRPREEVSALLTLFAHVIDNEKDFFGRNDIRLRFVGDTKRFPRALQTGMTGMEKMTRQGRQLNLTLALGYSGRWDILQAGRRLAADGGDFTRKNFEKYLVTADAPPPDLLIRTGGEMRISNFMLWQLAYAELYFIDKLWPDFDEADIRAAVDDFHRRERRFGGINGDGAQQ